MGEGVRLRFLKRRRLWIAVVGEEELEGGNGGSEADGIEEGGRQARKRGSRGEREGRREGGRKGRRKEKEKKE